LFPKKEEPKVMYKSIFLPVTSHGNQSAALSFGASLASALDAKAQVVFASKSISLLTSDQRWKIGDVMIKEGYAASDQLTEKLYLEQYQERAVATEKWFKTTCAALPGQDRLVWRPSLELFGETAEQVRDECSFHDMTIASFDLGASIFDDIVTGALFLTGRPLALIHAFAPGRKLEDLTVTLAFKQTPQFLRAQWHSLPLLQRAKRVLLITAAEDNEEDPEAMARFATYLLEHGVRTEPHVLYESGDAAMALEQYHLAQSSDLLVMGAFSHSRLSELVFGGFTRYFLKRTTCNLFLTH
jgi:nucleotide-binding universal stress UspA family protein